MKDTRLAIDWVNAYNEMHHTTPETPVDTTPLRPDPNPIKQKWREQAFERAIGQSVDTYNNRGGYSGSGLADFTNPKSQAALKVILSKRADELAALSGVPRPTIPTSTWTPGDDVADRLESLTNSLRTTIFNGSIRGGEANEQAQKILALLLKDGVELTASQIQDAYASLADILKNIDETQQKYKIPADSSYTPSQYKSIKENIDVTINAAARVLRYFLSILGEPLETKKKLLPALKQEVNKFIKTTRKTLPDEEPLQVPDLTPLSTGEIEKDTGTTEDEVTHMTLSQILKFAAERRIKLSDSKNLVNSRADVLNTLYPLKLKDLIQLHRPQLVRIAHLRNIDIDRPKKLVTKPQIVVALLKHFRIKATPDMLPEPLNELQIKSLTTKQILQYADDNDVDLSEYFDDAGDAKPGTTKSVVAKYIFDTISGTGV